MPVWTPDGKRIAFGQASAAGGYNVFWAPYDGSGTAERLTNDEGQQSAGSWSPDGRVLAYVHQPPSGLGDIYTVAVDENPRHPRPFLQTKANEGWPAFSPDGRWMAYASDESGTFEVYIRPYPGPGAKHQISTNGGNQPAWASNGRELFYRIRGALMAVAITTTPEFSAGIPRRLFEDRYAGGDPVRGYDVAPDGRFLMVVDPEPPAPPASQINVVFDWLPEFKRKLAGGS
jgi:Tol biopolymer transport system component